MRPRYDQRFEEFRQANLEALVTAIEQASEKLRPLKRSGKAPPEIPPDVYEAMQHLVSQWTQVRQNQNKLNVLLKRRKYLFVMWAVSFALSLLAIWSPDALVVSVPIVEASAPYTPVGQATLTLGQVACIFFLLILGYSAYYGWELFDLDERLSRFSGTIVPAGERAVATGVVVLRRSGSQLESDVGSELLKQGIRFETSPKLRTLPDDGGISYRPDFAIPSANDPRFLIEVKGSLTLSGAYVVSSLGRRLKETYPAARTVIVSTAMTHEVKRFLKKNWDYVFDLTELPILASAINEALHPSSR